MRVLVTGSDGFVGRHVIERLTAGAGYTVRGAVRLHTASPDPLIESASVGDIGPTTDWTAALNQIDVVVHAAARVHMMRDQTADPLATYRTVNTAGTMRLARQAASAGVRRFVFLSSIKVMSEQTDPGRPLRADDPVAPSEPYAVSKYEAEQGLRALAAETGLEVVIIRPVLVYGPGVQANFETMMRAVSRRMPLPLGAIHNKRSLVSVQNLANLIECCVRHTSAANQLFLVSDGEDLSTPDLLRRLACAMGVPSRLFGIPESLLMRAARLLGKANAAQRLLGSLQVDIEKTRTLLGWSPALSVDDGLMLAAQHFLRSERLGARLRDGRRSPRGVHQARE